MTLTPAGFVDLPRHGAGGFDHGDVHLASGRIFVAHTAAGTVEVIDGDALVQVGTVPGCPEASGVLCVQADGLVFAAARGAGRVLVIDAASLAVVREIATGQRPNGLAWRERDGMLLVADVHDFRARAVIAASGELAADVELPGRPRWCVHDAAADRFLVNIRDPACVAVLAGEPLGVVDRWPVTSAGPHGLDIDRAGARAFVAGDGGAVSVLDLATGGEVASVPIAGPPDAIWYSPPSGLLYVAIGDPGLVEVIDTLAMRVSERIVTEEGAHTIAFDAARRRLAVFLPGTCRVALYEEAGTGSC